MPAAYRVSPPKSLKERWIFAQMPTLPSRCLLRATWRSNASFAVCNPKTVQLPHGFSGGLFSLSESLLQGIACGKLTGGIYDRLVLIHTPYDPHFSTNTPKIPCFARFFPQVKEIIHTFIHNLWKIHLPCLWKTRGFSTTSKTPQKGLKTALFWGVFWHDFTRSRSDRTRPANGLPCRRHRAGTPRQRGYPDPHEQADR